MCASHNDEVVWFRVQPEEDPQKVPRSLAPAAGAPSALRLLSPRRLRLLADVGRGAWLRGNVAHCMRRLRGRASAGLVVADLSEGGLLAAFALRCLARRGPPRGPKAAGRAPLVSAKRQRLALASRPRRAREGGGARRRAAAGGLQLVAAGGGGLAGRCVAARVLERLRLRAQLRRRAPGLTFASASGWCPPEGTVDALLAEPYDGSVEDRECDLQLWQHWAQVDALRPSLRGGALGALVWPARFRLRCGLVACEGLWERRQRLRGGLVGGVDVSAMERLASPKFFPWAAADEGEQRRARFPYELWQEDHYVLEDRAAEGGSAVLCEVDVREALGARSFGAVRLAVPGPPRLPAGGAAQRRPDRPGVHAVATWTEVLSADGSAWRSTAVLEARGRWRAFAPGPHKQGVLLASRPWPAGHEGAACAPRAWVDVEAHFDPARGELRFTGRWGDGRAF